MPSPNYQSLFNVLSEARDKFPEAWRVFIMEFSEPVEARRVAFAALIGHVNSRLISQGSEFAAHTTEEWDTLRYHALESLARWNYMPRDFIYRCMVDCAQVEGMVDLDPAPRPDDGYSLSSLPLPSPQPTATVTLEPNSLITVECHHEGFWGFEVLVNYGDSNAWNWMGFCQEQKWYKGSAPRFYLDDDRPTTSPVTWKYRVRYRRHKGPGPIDSKPVGMWSEEIAVKLAEGGLGTEGTEGTEGKD